MKLQKILIGALTLLALTAPAHGQTVLKTALCGDMLLVEWSEPGECLLTVCLDGLPVHTMTAAGGRAEIPVDGVSGAYSVRLQTQDACLTAEAGMQTDAGQTPAQVDEPAVLPAQTVQKPAEPAEAAAVGQSMTSLAAEVIAQVNAERAKYGLSPLSVSAELTGAARMRAHEIVRSFSHTRPDGSSWSTVSDEALGENIARGHNSADRVMAAWLTSQGHRGNILSDRWGSIGVCALKVDGVLYWVQLFGR